MLRIFPNTDELNDFAAEKFIETGNSAIKSNKRFAVALAGGSTPKSLYAFLTSEKYRDQMDWEKVFFFFGDERDVPPDSAKSNFRMANESLLEPLQISENNIFRWRTELPEAEQIAGNYAETLRRFFNLRDNEFPRFDLILLGMGEDGHTASLFPFSDALNETKKITVTNQVKQLDTTRFTLTFPTINNAANILFLVAGDAKAAALKNVLEGESQPEKFPSQRVKPHHGNLFWLVDQSAAKLI